ncbi:MAG: hypothetical protein AAF669_05820 [Pseudomonadota bacterium]
MTTALREPVERVTVYLTPQNRRRLANLRRGEKTKTVNEALNYVFEREEKQRYFEEFMDTVRNTKPVTPLVSGVNTIRRLREGRDRISA